MAPCPARAQWPGWGVGLRATNRAPSLLWEASYRRVRRIGSVGHFPQLGQFSGPTDRPFAAFRMTLTCCGTTVARGTLTLAALQSRRCEPTAMKRIFVVEDNPAIRELILELVSSFGYSGQGVSDGADLLARLEESVPDLVVMDVRMPNLDGLQAIRRIRERASLKNLPVIALTASAMRGDREIGLQSGFDAYLTKPIDPDLLQNEIERLLAA
jgi:CheY-like chemotaxis protein